MASNRKITEFPLIIGGEVDDEDLLTIVHIFEVDPTLRNKKLTFSGLKKYLDNFYLNTTSGGRVIGDLEISGNLTVTGYGDFNYIDVTTSGNFNTINVTSNAVIGGNITGVVISGQNVVISDGLDATTITGDTVTGTTAQFTTGVFQRVETLNTVTGNRAEFNEFQGGTAVLTTSVSGATVTGNTGEFTTGIIHTLIVSSGHTIGGDLTVTGNLNVSGDFVLDGSGTINETLHVESGITNSGDISTITITGSGAAFTTITGTTVTGTDAKFASGDFTTKVSGLTITGTSGNFTRVQAVSGIYTSQLSGLTVTGTSALFTVVTGVSGVFTEEISGTTITGTTIRMISGAFESGTFTENLYGQTVTGLTARFVSGVFSSEVSAPEVTGQTARFQTITGGFGNFTTLTGVTFTGDTINAQSGTFTTIVSGTTVTGDTINGTTINAVTLQAINLSFSGDQTISGNFDVIGTGSFQSTVNLSGITRFSSGTQAGPSITYLSDTGVGLFFSSGTNTQISVTTSGTERVRFADDAAYVLNNLRVSGTTNVSGDATFSGDVQAATVLITTPSGGTPAAIISGVVSGNTSGLVVQGPLIILP
mgnify:FL=1